MPPVCQIVYPRGKEREGEGAREFFSYLSQWPNHMTDDELSDIDKEGEGKLARWGVHFTSSYWLVQG
jgi:hypothetical protein